MTRQEQREDARKDLRASLEKSLVPEHIHAGIISYSVDRVPPGHFLKSVFQNDLYKSLGYADEANRRAIGDIVGFIYAELPDECWGDESTYYRWITTKEVDDGER